MTDAKGRSAGSGDSEAHNTSKAAQVISPLTFAKRLVLSLVAAIVVSAALLPLAMGSAVPGGDKESAKEALVLLKDWTVWMAGIQTATVAALGLLAKDGAPALRLTDAQRRLAVLVVVLNGAALFFSAWILTSLSSLMLRVYQDCLVSYDFYNRPLYAFMEGRMLAKYFTVAFFAFWNHWLWAAGICAFAVLSISLVARGDEAGTHAQSE